MHSAIVTILALFIISINTFQEIGQVDDIWHVTTYNAEQSAFDSGKKNFGRCSRPNPDQTIYQFLSHDKRFTRVTKVINLVEDVVNLLNDSSARITFFAPPDEYLHRPHDKKNLPDLCPQNDFTDSDIGAFLSNNQLDMLDVLDVYDDISADSANDQPDKDKCRRFLKMLLRALLIYHIIPEEYDFGHLSKNTTFPTNLTIAGAMDGQPLRVRVEQLTLPPVITLNVISKIICPDMKATNGFVHVVNHVIPPPLSIFQELFMIPQFFSTFTSALQHSNLTSSVDLWYDPEKKLSGKLQGTSIVTVFAPANHAFEKLPKKLRLFLFSPFGHRALRKLLAYHIVPDLAIHSDYIYNHTENQKFTGENECLEHSELIYRAHLLVNTLLPNRTAEVDIERKEVKIPFPGPIETVFTINDQRAIKADLIALNGAFHVIGKVLDPRKSPKRSIVEGSGWENWEEWLPHWADEEE